MTLTPKLGQRLEPIVYWCDERKKRYKRNALIDDDLELRRKLCGVELILKTAHNGHKYVMVKSINGVGARHVGSGSKSLPGFLFGSEFTSSKRKTDELWDFTREAYGIVQADEST